MGSPDDDDTDSDSSNATDSPSDSEDSVSEDDDDTEGDSGDDSSADTDSADDTDTETEDDDDDDSGSSSADDDNDTEDTDTGGGGELANVDTNTFSEVDECARFEGEECIGNEDNYDEFGNAKCAQNQQTGDCYSVVRSQGSRGRGGFDDGYVAAEEAAEKESGQLYVVVGVLGGIIGALMLVIVGGIYYGFKRRESVETEGNIKGIQSMDMEMIDIENGGADDKGINVKYADTDAML